jgi:glutamyl-tRNA reductase
VAQTGITRLATEALRTGKRVRTETSLARNRLSIPHAAIELATGLTPGGLRGRSALVIGAGKMATLTAKLLRRDGVAELMIANRTPARGAALAAQVEGRAVPLDAVPGLLPAVDLVFGATGATGAPALVVDAAMTTAALRERATALLMIDLAVPRSIDPRLDELPAVRLLDVDAVEPVVAAERQRAEADIGQAEQIIAEGVATFMRWWRARPVTPAIASLQHRAEQIRVAELERALRKLGHLSERDQEVVKALSVGIVNKLLHQPVTRLRHAAGDDPAIGTVIELFGIDGASVPALGEPEDALTPVSSGERSG